MSDETHLPCPYGSCGSSDAFSWNPSKGIGMCHSCNTGYPTKGMNLLQVFDWAKEDYPLKDNKDDKPVVQRDIASGTTTGRLYRLTCKVRLQVA
jgi:hypothetical protein